MCTLCASLSPSDQAISLADQHVAPASAPVSAPGSLPNYSLAQIADQLTHGFWEWSGASWRAFDLGPGRTLSIDLFDLSQAERFIARTALAAWTDATGIRFTEVATTSEGPTDAAANRNTAEKVAVGGVFYGDIATDRDTDWIAVNLVAGKTYTFTLLSAQIDDVFDPKLALRNSAGTVLASNDDVSWNDYNSELTFTAATGGTYYLQANSALPGGSGEYRIAVSRAGETRTGAHITFRNDIEDAAWAVSDVLGNDIQFSLVNIGRDFSDDPLSLDAYWLETYIHEVGHALGLGHAGNYNGSADWSEDASYRQDSVLFSVMSYFFTNAGDPEMVNPYYRGSWGTVATVMAADLIAIQNLYGKGAPVRAGDTTYGANSNLGGYLGQLFGAIFDGDDVSPAVWNGGNMIMTIHDSGGFDVIDLSTISVAQTINLGQNVLSSVAGSVRNLNIAAGTVIEGAIGGRAADRMSGNGAGNLLSGCAGNDQLNGLNGDDTLLGGFGNDILRGGEGLDTASWAGSAAAIRASLELASAQVTGLGRDTLVSVENLNGGRAGDRLVGDRFANRLDGAAGNDGLFGHEGKDVLVGQQGNDTLEGGHGDDRLLGGAGADTFRFNAGSDLIMDFQDDIDTIALARSLWGGGNRAVGAILNAAQDLGTSVLLTFETGHRIVVQGALRIDDLRDDIILI